MNFEWLFSPHVPILFQKKHEETSADSSLLKNTRETALVVWEHE